MAATAPTAGESSRSSSRRTEMSTSSALDAALTEARADADRPTFIRLRSQIAWPAPNAANTGAAHGSALGADEVAATKRVLGFADDATFSVAPEVLRHARQVGDRGRAAPRTVARAVQRLGSGQPPARCPARTAGEGPASGRLAAAPAHLRTWHRRGHEVRIRQDPRRARRRAPRALGWLSRPGRLQQHDDAR